MPQLCRPRRGLGTAGGDAGRYIRAWDGFPRADALGYYLSSLRDSKKLSKEALSYQLSAVRQWETRRMDLLTYDDVRDAVEDAGYFTTFTPDLVMGPRLVLASQRRPYGLTGNSFWVAERGGNWYLVT